MRPKLHPEPERIVSSGMLRVDKGVGVIDGVAVGIGVGVGVEVATGSGVVGVAVGVGKSVVPSFDGSASNIIPDPDDVLVAEDVVVVVVEDVVVAPVGVGVGVGWIG
jgi:hypothetical protein